MILKTVLAAVFAVALSCVQAFGQATILPPGKTCWQATTGISGMVGTVSFAGGSGYTSQTYGGVALTGGSGSGATANITVSGGIVTQVAILNPGVQYQTGDILTATLTGGAGFSATVTSTAINSAVAGGSVAFYIPNTQSPKQTYQDPGQTILNTNPVALDQNGCALVYGTGSYLESVMDSLGNVVYTALTASTGPSGLYWAGLATGTGNAIQINDPGFALQDGATIQFLASAANNGPTNVTVSGIGPIAIVEDTSSGPTALSGGEIGPGNTPIITYDATNAEFHIVNPAESSGTSSTTSSLTPPQGYLNLVGQASGDVIQTNDVTGAVTVYYSPFTGNTLPVWNGSTFKSVVFSELTATLNSSGSAANAIQDECVFSNNGVPTLVTGPAWSTPAAGSGNRGTGAGSAQIIRLQGIWVNANAIVGYNGLSSYSIAANQCTYVGSISIDATAGQVSAYVTWGASRKWGVWNAYNRQPIQMQAGITTSYSYTTSGWRAVGADTTSSIQVFTGLPEEPSRVVTTGFVGATMTTNQSTGGAVGVGLNSTTSPSGHIGEFTMTNSNASPIVYSSTVQGSLLVPPALGINTVQALENGLGVTLNTWTDNFQSSVLSAGYRG
jgi:hypothetical protein